MKGWRSKLVFLFIIYFAGFATAAISGVAAMLYRQITISVAQLAHNLLNIHLSVLLMPIVQLVK